MSSSSDMTYRHCLLVVCSVLLLAGCSPEVTAHEGESQDDTLQSENLVIPDFVGPYKDELIRYYRQAHSEFFREVIKDQWVSDEEYHEAQERSRVCLEDAGFTGVEYFPEGGSAVAERSDISTEEAMDLHEECEVSTGLAETEIWRSMLRRNPDNVDWPTAERDCLVKAGLLPEGTTVEEMNEWYASQAPGSRSQLAYQCSQDALGHLGVNANTD